jgi:hypothetical protein
LPFLMVIFAPAAGGVTVGLVAVLMGSSPRGSPA